ncbi:peroxisomal membrane protein PEX14 [Phalaenopsis equestris]|uniref:peroxisomal membrane protein PEX14 n=1 Tax=Phalaenopsis equestris TaxID=78828 RepID=UPI0009E407DF|nr:peroxisomal membrane protein PEX14 [Phalaenopsis equestris]
MAIEGGGGGDERPQSKGPELSQPTSGIAQSEPVDGSEQKLPFITSEPLREDQVQNAVKFLSHPKVKGSPVIYRRSFLERKGLTKEEIDEAFRRVPDPSPNATITETVATSQATQMRTSASLQPQTSVQPHPPAAANVGAASLVPTYQKPRFNWSHALIAIGVLSASGAGSAVLFKVKVVLPRLKAWIRRVAVEDTGSVKEDKASKSLAAETAEAVKAAASAAATVATASQELLNSKNEDRKYFEALMGMIDVQVKEMKYMSGAIQKLEKEREQQKLINEYAQYATTNGTSNNSWKSSQVNQTDSQVKVNGTLSTNYGAGQSLTPPSVELTTASHPKSYMEIMAMVQRGEKPPNIREVNDMPPNPNQPPSKPILAPRTKPWEISPENGQPQDVSSEPWWRKKSVKITELESDGEEPSRQPGATDWPSSQRSWVPPQPPSVAMPESAAAIRHRKPSTPIQDQSSGDDENAAKSSIDSHAAVSQQSEIEEVRENGVEVI